jgi:hypothetical protein
MADRLVGTRRWLALVFILDFLVFAAPFGVGGTRAQSSGPFAIRYSGVFHLGSQPAPAGLQLSVVTARGATDTVVCGATSTSDGGNYTITVASQPRCADVGNGGLTNFYFVYDGEVVGTSNTHIDLNDPRSLGRTVHTDVAAPVIPRLQQTAQQLIVIRYYGVFHFGAQVAPAGVALSVITERSATDTFVCGMGQTTDGGNYVFDVQPETRCSDAGNGGLTDFYFVYNQETVGRINTHLDLNEPRSLGRTVHTDLASASSPPAPAPSATPLTGGVSTAVPADTPIAGDVSTVVPEAPPDTGSGGGFAASVFVCGVMVSSPTDIFSQLINCLPARPGSAAPTPCPASLSSGSCAGGGGFFSPSPTSAPPQYQPPLDPPFGDCVSPADLAKILSYMLSRDKDASKPGSAGDLARRGYGNWRANSAEAKKIMDAFVGSRGRPSSSGKALVGPVDSLKQRIARGPTVKARDGKTQVNLEIWTYDSAGNKTLTTNAHIDIDNGGCP